MILWDNIISYCVYNADRHWSSLKVSENFLNFLNFLRSYKVYTPCCMEQHVIMDNPYKPEIVFVLFIMIVVGKLI